MLRLASMMFLWAACGLSAVAAGADFGAATNTLWFPVGETMVYKLYWGVIPVGHASFSTEWLERDGEWLVRIRARAKSNRVLSAVYPVDDRIESLVRPDTFLPVRYVQKLNEGKHVRHDIISFDHDGGRAYWESGRDGSSKTLEIDPDCRDILTFTYFMRSKGFAVGQQAKFRVLADEKVYDLSVTGVEREAVKVGGHGEVMCLKVEPKAKFGEIFVRSGKVLLWFSEDARHVCTRMAGKVPLAHVKAKLQRVEGPGADVWGRRKP